MVMNKKLLMQFWPCKIVKQLPLTGVCIETCYTLISARLCRELSMESTQKGINFCKN